MLVWVSWASAEAGKAFELVDGDRVVLVGNTYIEQEQAQGYLETLLTARYAERNVTFRNLGWSGDDVLGRARVEFAALEKGVEIVTKQVAEAKPTVILIGYGMNESYAGPAGLGEFVMQYSALLDAFKKSGARLVLLGPIRHEDLGRPLPDPAEHNKNLKLYSDAIGKMAGERGCGFVDLFEVTAGPGMHLTSDGIHPTAYGYWRLAVAVMQGLGIAPAAWEVNLDVAGASSATGCKLGDVKLSARGGTFAVTDAMLPAPAAPLAGASVKSLERVVRVKGLVAGTYVLKAGDARLASGSAEAWAKGMQLTHGPETERVEQLRQAINAKSGFFFRRWRPQNDTYILGFRKHEQGRNEVEIQQLDPLVAEKEAEIAKLRTPVAVSYSLQAE